MSKIKKWQLLEKQDVSPSKFFPLEKRKYELPDGRVVDNFFVTTLRDSVHVIPITEDGKIILIRMYKQGVDQVVTQFPAGRMELSDHDPLATALRELEEEAGIKAKSENLIFIKKMAIMTTKSSEYVHFFVAKDVLFNSNQNLDDNEEIEVITATPQEVDHMIANNEIIEGVTIASWFLVKESLFQTS
jgi:ADP-ribose pyrophosphatase